MKFFWVFITVLLVSCNEKIFTGNVDCDQCYVDKQENADLVIDLSVNKKYPAVPVWVYEGDVEDDNLVYSDTAYSTPYYVYVRVGRKYSVKAEYRSAEKTIYSVNGTNLKTLVVTDACDETCYIVENQTIDVKLRSEP
jgi:hypothetical protein